MISTSVPHRGCAPSPTAAGTCGAAGPAPRRRRPPPTPARAAAEASSSDDPSDPSFWTGVRKHCGASWRPAFLSGGAAGSGGGGGQRPARKKGPWPPVPRPGGACDRARDAARDAARRRAADAAAERGGGDGARREGDGGADPAAAPAASPDPPRDSTDLLLLSEMAAVALPTLAALACDPVAGLVDTAWVGRLPGTAELASVGVGTAAAGLVSKTVNNPLLAATTSAVAEASGRDA